MNAPAPVGLISALRPELDAVLAQLPDDSAQTLGGRTFWQGLGRVTPSRSPAPCLAGGQRQARRAAKVGSLKATGLECSL